MKKKEIERSVFCDIEPQDLNINEWLKLINKAIEICKEWRKDIMKKEYLPGSGIMPLYRFVGSHPKGWGVIVRNGMELPWEINYHYFAKKRSFPKGLEEDAECIVLAFNVNERTEYSMTYNVFLMSIEHMKLVYCKAKFKLKAPNIEGFFKFSFVNATLLDRFDGYRELGLGPQMTERLEDLLRINANTLLARALKIRDSTKELNMLWRGFYLHRD